MYIEKTPTMLVIHSKCIEIIIENKKTYKCQLLRVKDSSNLRMQRKY